jgi:chromosomal replication initiation ATPase DnaA
MDIKLVVEPENPEKPTLYAVKTLIKAVCETFIVDEDMLLSKRRMGFVVSARNALYYLGYRNTSHTTVSLGNFLGRDHTTILHGLKNCKAMMERNNNYAYKVEQAHLLAIKYEIPRKEHLEKLREEVEEMIQRIQMEKLNGL